MKRLIYIIMMIYYLAVWIDGFFGVLPVEIQLGYGIFVLKAIAEIGINFNVEWSLFYLPLIIFTTLSHFRKKYFYCIPIIILAFSLIFNLLSIIMAYGIPLLINFALIFLTIYVAKKENTPSEPKGENT